MPLCTSVRQRHVLGTCWLVALDSVDAVDAEGLGGSVAVGVGNFDLLFEICYLKTFEQWEKAMCLMEIIVNCIPN